MFKEWNQLVENQTGRTVKKLRTDNGLESCNREFEQLCIESKLELRAVKCVLLGYPEGVKGYRLYRLDDESPKIVTTRNMVFKESVMYKDTLKDSGVGNKSVKELQVEVELQSNMVAYAFVATEEEDTHEPLAYQEAVACEDSSKWKVAMKEDLGISRSSSWVKA
nr:retrotransposon protein, putative, Ty1-copia subclass [Tanacetum cinerariifolium]